MAFSKSEDVDFVVVTTTDLRRREKVQNGSCKSGVHPDPRMYVKTNSSYILFVVCTVVPFVPHANLY